MKRNQPFYFFKMDALTKKIFVLCLFLVGLVNVFAQSKTITGTVLDATKEALPGVSVAIINTTNGTMTDLDGAFTLTANVGDVLEISFVGMKTQTITISANQNNYPIILQEDSNMLEETVVIGYGSAKAKDLTSPIATIGADEVGKHLTASPMQGLQGKVSGVQIINSGQPGSSPKVRIRGAGNFDKDKQGPLYVVDGMMFDNIDFLSSNDIENISILKDASSAAIYGVRAANGVVLVTTKKGVPNRKPQVTYDGYVGFQKASNVMKMANSEQYSTFMREVGDAGIIKYIDNSINVWGGENGTPSTNTDWYKQLLRTALMHSHGVSVTGGAENLSYSVGANYLYQDGIMNVDNGYERVNTRAKIDLGLTDWLKIGASFIMTNSDQQTNAGNAWLGAYHNPSIYPVYDSNRTTDLNPHGFASPQQIGMPNYFWNPMAIAQYGENQSYKRNQILPSFYAEAQFLDDRLTARSAFSQDITFLRYRQFTPSYDLGSDIGSNQLLSSSYLQKRTEYTNNWIIDNTLTFRDNIGKHNYSIMAGNSVRNERWELQRIEGTAVPAGKEEYWYVHQGIQKPSENKANDEGTWPDNGTEYRGVSFFGRLMYDYDGKYLLSATMRADGTSKYQEKWGYFPSIGLGWVVTKEGFMKEQKALDFLKLRVNWGKLGNDKVKASDGFASMTPETGIFDDTKVPGYTGLSYFSSLKWEVVEEHDLGLDFTVLNNRLSGNIDYFNRKTKNAVFAKSLPFGAASIMVNGGEIQNKGVEVSLNWNDNIGKDFNYFVGVNMTSLKNKVTKLDGLNMMENNNSKQVKMIGQSMDAFYGYKVLGVYQNWDEIKADPIAVANGLEPGDFKYQDTDGDGVLTADDRVILGSHIPKFTLGGNLGFSFKNIDFSMAFQGQFNYKIYNDKRTARFYQSSLNMDEEWYENRWTGEGSTNKYPSAKGSNKSWNIGKPNSFFVENASHFSIQNIQVGYTFLNVLPNSGNKSSLRLSLTAERPFNFFSYNGFTTDISDGIDSNVYPMASTYSFGVKFIY